MNKLYKTITRILPLTVLTMIITAVTFTVPGVANATPFWAWPGTGFAVKIGHNEIQKCSVGWPAKDAEGNHYFITASHCFKDDYGRHYYRDGNPHKWLQIYSLEDLSTPVGYEYVRPVNSLTPYLDVSLVKIYPGMKLSGDGWNNLNPHPHEARVGETACVAGIRHRAASCGTVTAVNVRRIPSNTITAPYKVDRANYCAWSGDSGGPVYNEYGALGIHTAGIHQSDGICYSEDGEMFTPINDILRLFRDRIPSLTINQFNTSNGL